MFTRNLASLLSALVLLAFSAKAQLAGQTVKLQTVLGSGAGKCLAATNLANGAPVVIEDCGANATSLNSWTVSGGSGVRGQLSLTQYCLDVTDGVDADGTKLQIWLCGPRDTAQQFTPTSGSTIQWDGGSNNKCVDVTDGNLTNGNRVQVWDCDANNSNQKFNAIPVTFPAWFSVERDHTVGNCITAENAVNASVTIGTCTNDFAKQTFTDPTHTGQMVMYDNLCVTPLGNNLNDGTKLILAPCDANNAAQIWSHQTGIINSHSFAKACIDLTDGNMTPGNQLQVWTCTSLTSTTDNTNQDWVVSNHW
ncbi:hypothetical protein MVEN_01763600 [Mycena venus]|uniref:Ricin B lectin domain-containing protein n=1 Tax=Mycena venus TaxID=2733690 RepID=A0A8H6XL85_9AGAR|nr:hypothetical protein MVEN_01763600 [Mycena venus]